MVDYGFSGLEEIGLAFCWKVAVQREEFLRLKKEILHSKKTIFCKKFFFLEKLKLLLFLTRRRNTILKDKMLRLRNLCLVVRRRKIIFHLNVPLHNIAL